MSGAGYKETLQETRPTNAEAFFELELPLTPVGDPIQLDLCLNFAGALEWWNENVGPEEDLLLTEPVMSAIGQVFAAMASRAPDVRPPPSDVDVWAMFMTSGFLDFLSAGIEGSLPGFPLATAFQATIAIFRAALAVSDPDLCSELLSSHLGYDIREQTFLDPGIFFDERLTLAELTIRLVEPEFADLLGYGIRCSRDGFLPPSLAECVPSVVASYWNGRMIRDKIGFYQGRVFFVRRLLRCIWDRESSAPPIPTDEHEDMCEVAFSALLILARHFEVSHAAELLRDFEAPGVAGFLMRGYVDSNSEQKCTVIMFLHKCLENVWRGRSTEELRGLFNIVALDVIPDVRELLDRGAEAGLAFLLTLCLRGACCPDDAPLFKWILETLECDPEEDEVDGDPVPLPQLRTRILVDALRDYWIRIIKRTDT